MEPSTQIKKRCLCGSEYDPTFGDGDCCHTCRDKALHKNWKLALESIPERYQYAKYEDLIGMDKQIAKARKYVTEDHHQSAWLTIQGASGNGKTHLAAVSMAHYAFTYVKSTAWINAGELASEVMDLAFKGGVGAYLSQYISPYLLVLDDLGVEGMQDSVRVAMYRLINTRWERRLRTIITTNMSIADIATKSGQQIADRLLRTGTFIRVGDASYAWKKILEKQHGGSSSDPTPGGQAKANLTVCPEGSPSILNQQEINP